MTWMGRGWREAISRKESSGKEFLLPSCPLQPSPQDLPRAPSTAAPAELLNSVLSRSSPEAPDGGAEDSELKGLSP